MCRDSKEAANPPGQFGKARGGSHSVFTGGVGERSRIGDGDPVGAHRIVGRGGTAGTVARRFGIGRTFLKFGFVVPGPRGAIAGERSGKDVVGVCYVTDALNHARLFMEVELSSKFLRRGKVDPDFRVRRHVLLQSACGERPAEFDRIRIPGTLRIQSSYSRAGYASTAVGRIGHGFNSGGADLVNRFLQIGLRDGAKAKSRSAEDR